MKIVSHIKKCRDFAPNVTRALDNLFEDMSACAKSKTGKSYSQVRPELENKIFLSKTDFLFKCIAFFTPRLHTVVREIKMRMCRPPPLLSFYRLRVMAWTKLFRVNLRRCCAITSWTACFPSPSSLRVSLPSATRLVTWTPWIRDACRTARGGGQRWPVTLSRSGYIGSHWSKSPVQLWVADVCGQNHFMLLLFPYCSSRSNLMNNIFIFKNIYHFLFIFYLSFATVYIYENE